jgi:molybdopterin-containing oxidoreductase family iron-sulfur binding subunit
MACKAENMTSAGVWWNKVTPKEEGTYPTATLTFLPAACMHCDNPACVAVCPVGATHRRADGIVVQDKDKCIGCQRCIGACPYGARTYLEAYTSYYPDYGATPQERFGAAFHKAGTVEKCTLCSHLVDAGEQPACVQACPASARVFGDLDEPDSAVAKIIAARKGTQLKAEMGTRPKVYYLR